MKKSETRILLKLAKKVVEKQTYKKLKKLPQEEKLQAIKYSIISALEKKHHELSKKVAKNFTAKTKLLALPSKIKHFKVNYDKDEFYKVYKLIRDIEKEIKNVAV